ncbi:MAG: BTAD domain-containing putative transcriptional regulator [Anaerolineae bacterium]
MLKIFLLGQFLVEQDGQVVDVASRPVQSLLAYLVLTTGTRHRRERLGGILWPESAESNARSNLRHALWRLRKALGDAADHVVTDDLTIAFDNGDDVWIDTAILARPLSAGQSIEDFEAAVSLYRGDLLPGFYDDWVFLERERLHAILEQKMGLLLDGLVQEGRWQDVLEWGERWIALGQVPEPAYRALMMAHAGLGDLAGMASVYQRCSQALERELGVEPSEQTLALYEELAAGKLFGGEVSWQPGFGAAPDPGEAPFKGLRYFGEEDATLFFGREELTARMVDHLRTSRFLAVVGASGSGKSSVVRAGLVPALKRGDAPVQDGHVHVITPTAHPLESLAVSLTRDETSLSAAALMADDLARDPRALRLYAQRQVGGAGELLLLVVDQFEELFTQCRSEAERQAFVDNVLTAACPPVPGEEDSECDAGQHVAVVVALRADFYAHCSPYAGLREALERHQVFVGPMSREGLRRAVEEPARQGGWAFQPGLVDLLLQEVKDEPGALPLLSHALLETWHRRRGRTMTLAGYHEAGGVRSAIAHTANRVLDELDPEEQVIARRIFVRLTELGEGTQDTRRRVALSELVSGAADASRVEAVLHRLAAARLVTVGEGTAEVAHEALIREWPALREWLDEGRESIRLHRHLTESARAWQRLDRDPGELYRGARLAQASEWAEAHAGELNPLEGAFLSASLDHARQLEAEREAQRQRELEAARRLAEEQTRTAAAEKKRAAVQARATRRLRRLAAVLGVLMLVALVSALMALRQTQRAEDQAQIARVRELAAASGLQLDADPERSALLALEAIDVTHSAGKSVLPEAANALHRALPALRTQRILTGHDGRVWGLAYSPDGQRLATAGDDATVRVWNVHTGKQVLTLTGHSATIHEVAFSPDGRRIATASFDDTARVWDAATGAELLVLSGHSDNVLDVAFSPDGARLATSSDDTTAKIWDAVSGEELLTLSAHTEAVLGLAFSPDGRYLATASDDNWGRVWDLDGGQLLFSFVHGPVVSDMAFSPDGTRLFTAQGDTTVKVWDVSHVFPPPFSMTGGEADPRLFPPKPLFTLSGHTQNVARMALSPDGAYLATASSDGLAIVWDVQSGEEKLRLAGHRGWVTNVAFSPDGRHLATTSTDGTARVWDWATPSHEVLTLAGHEAKIDAMALSPDGRRLATIGRDSMAKVWDLETGKELVKIIGGGNALELWVASIAFSPDGTRLTSVAVDGSPRVWDAATGKRLLLLAGHGAPVAHVEFSRDGTLLVTAGGRDQTARVWDAATGQQVTILTGHSGAVLHATFSPDGTRIATASEDATARIWDTATGQALATLSAHTAGVAKSLFSPDGARLVTIGLDPDTSPKVWDVVSGEELFTLTGHNGPVLDAVFSSDGALLATADEDGTARVWNMATGEALQVLAGDTNSIFHLTFSPDDTLVATAGFDGQARVWDVDTGQELLALTGHTGGVNAVAFAPDGTRLITAGDDGTVRIYALPVQDVVDLAEERLTRTWTEQECRQFLHLPADECRQAYAIDE